MTSTKHERLNEQAIACIDKARSIRNSKGRDLTQDDVKRIQDLTEEAKRLKDAADRAKADNEVFSVVRMARSDAPDFDNDFKKVNPLNHTTIEGAGSWLPSVKEQKDLTTQTGAPFIPDEQASQFMRELEARSVVIGSRIRLLTMTGSTLNVPKVAGGISVDAYNEGDPITASDLNTDTIALDARKLAALTAATNESLNDSNPELRQVVASELAVAAALKLDSFYLEGDGVAPNLMGIRNLAVNTTELGSADGATPTLDDVAAAIGRLEANNGNAAAIFMAPRTWATFRELKDADQRYQLQPTPTAAARRSLFDVPVKVSSKIATTETVGTSNDCSWFAVVDTSKVVGARRKDVEVKFDESVYFESDKTAVRAISRWAGLALADDNAIELVTGVRP